ASPSTRSASSLRRPTAVPARSRATARASRRSSSNSPASRRPAKAAAAVSTAASAQARSDRKERLMRATSRKPLLALLAGSLCALAASISDAAASTGSCEREILAAAAKYDIPAGILYSVGLTETGRKGSLQPFALNIEGKAYFGASREEALRTFEA